MTIANPKDPAAAVPLARQLILSGAWRTAPRRGDATDKATYLLRARLPAALSVLGRSAVAGLTRQPPPGGCNWCVARFWAAASLGADPAPEDNDYTRAFLGSQCGRCRIAYEAAEVAARERRYTTDLVAAGFPSVAVSLLRTPRQVWQQMVTVPPSTAFPGGPAPTGILWPAGGGQPVAARLATGRGGSR